MFLPSGGVFVSEPVEKSAVSMRMADAVTAIIIFVIGAIVVWDSYRSGAKWTSEGPETGYFPFYIGLILCVASIVNIINAFRQTNARDSFVSVSSLKAVFSVLIPTTIYVALINGIGPIPGLGIYVASAIFIAAFMIWLGKYSWLKSVSVGVAVPFVFFLMFEVWFTVPLPKGPLEAMLGLD
jgi:putative tricarboxylic transport membrane protein